MADATEADTDLVIEMGSGWGWHILTAFTTGGPREATYVAAEYTEAGRDCAARLAQLDDHLKFQAIHFDYHEPSFAGLPKARHAVVFSAHSIGRGFPPASSRRCSRPSCSVAERVTVVQFEPVGWQVGPEHDGRGTSSSYADAHDYTRNYVPPCARPRPPGPS